VRKAVVKAVLMLVGIGLIGILTATVASFFIGQDVDDERDALQKRLDRLEEMLTRALSARGIPDTAVDAEKSEPPKSN
jgi:hypothetical protein